MDKREKVIEHLQDCIDYLDGDRERHWVFVRGNVIRAAFQLLKAQEPKQVFPIGYVGTSDNQYATCPGCLSRIHSNESPHYCGYCGQAVNWNG